ncbi:MAG: metal-dependent hydrolase [Planctomycetaceae bacterium]|nr:metal-dependent hydrolase [Planctomycetaceae bacterium]
MRIQLLGTGGYYPNDKRHTACYLLAEAGIVLDAGTATYRLPALTRDEHQDVFLTHAHLDHVFGLTFLLVPILNQQYRRVTVHGTQQTIDAIQNFLFQDVLFPVDPPFQCEVIPPTGEMVIRDQYRVRWQPLPSHPGGSTAFRIERFGEGVAPSSFAYVTDTRVDGSYVDFIREVDLLIHECYFPDDKEGLAELTGHSIARDVANVAREANVGRLIAIHVDPQSNEEDPIGLEGMRATFANTELAVDQMDVDIP